MFSNGVRATPWQKHAKRESECQEGAPLVVVRTPLSVLTTFPTFYAIVKRNRRMKLGNVVEGSVTCHPRQQVADLRRPAW